MNDIQCKNILDILVTKNFNFKHLSCGLSILDRACINTTYITNTNWSWIKYLTRIEEYDVSSSVAWLHTIIHKYTTNYIYIIIINNILARSDYISFLNRIIYNYGRVYASADEDMLFIINMIGNADESILIKMIMYKNDEGNTIAHIAAMYHLDRTLRFIITHPNKTIAFEPNNNNETVRNLYITFFMLEIL